MEDIYTSKECVIQFYYILLLLLLLLLLQLVLALRYIHKDRHIIHRDLTASNVMVTNEDHVMLSKELMAAPLTHATCYSGLWASQTETARVEHDAISSRDDGLLVVSK